MQNEMVNTLLEITECAHLTTVLITLSEIIF
jgi:hypothetical protein